MGYGIKISGQARDVRHKGVLYIQTGEKTMECYLRVNTISKSKERDYRALPPRLIPPRLDGGVTGNREP